MPEPARVPTACTPTCFTAVKMMPPGCIFVTMQPADELPLDDFNDWYNNEHGPNRLRLPFILNGLRYRATDGLRPEWMAVYDTPDLENFTQPAYTNLRTRSVQSQREMQIMPNIKISRAFYALEHERSKEGFRRPE